MGRRLSIYGNWSAYDELSDGVPLTEELAIRQFEELLRLRSFGVQFDAYLMDAFWFDPLGGYRTWRQPNWPNGPDRWLEACREHGILPGLWFTANTLCHLEPATAWLDSADESGQAFCCFHGRFLSDYLNLLDDWYLQGIRIFKFDFADFRAAPPEIKAGLSEAEIRSRNENAFREGLKSFRSGHPEAILMGFNGFESKEYMDRTDRPLEPVIDLRWLDAFDSIYSGDPRPADVPTVPLWRSVDIYGDHMTRVLEQSGVPLHKIDNCGFMAGPTGTCYWRGKAMWKGMLILTLARGGDLTVLYGDLSQFDKQDALWMASVQRLFDFAFESGGADHIGGLPGRSEAYGWKVAGQILVAVNPLPEISTLSIPAGNWSVAFCDSGIGPELGASAIRLGPFQMAMLVQNGASFGVQDDCLTEQLSPVDWSVLEQSNGHWVIELMPGRLRIFVQQLDKDGRLIRTYAHPRKASEALSLSAFQGGEACLFHLDTDRVVWSGMSWSAADIDADGTSPVRIEIIACDPEVADLRVHVWRIE